MACRFFHGQSSLVYMYITGHVRGHKLSPKGRTDMKIGPSRVKNCVEFHGNLRFSIAPQKSLKKCEKLIFRLTNPFFVVAQKFASTYFRGDKVASKYFRRQN